MSYLVEFDTTPIVLGSQINASTQATSETKVASIKVPANSMGANGYLHIIYVVSFTSNANNKTYKVRWGAANDLTGTTISSNTTNTNASVQKVLNVSNANGTGSQLVVSAGNDFTVYASDVILSPTADTTVDAYVVFSGSVANAADTLTFEYYAVILYPGV